MPRNYKKKSNRSSCGMKYVSSYRTPCQALPLDANFAISQSGGFQGNNVDVSRGCVSYNVDVNAPQIAGQPVISGNPTGCLSGQMDGSSAFNPPAPNYMAGGGASCSGVGFDLTSQIAGQPVVLNNAPNCLYGEVANPNAVLSGGEMNTPSPVLSGGRRKSKSKSKSKKGKKRNTKRRVAKGVKKSTKRNKKVVKQAINDFCKKKNLKCSKKIKNRIYNSVISRLCD